MSDVPLLSASGLCSSRSDGSGPVADCSVAFDGGAICVLSGAAGSGQHRLLRLLGLLEVPDAGELRLKGESTGGWGEIRRAEARNASYGFLFPSPFLLPAFNVVENVAMPYFKLHEAAPEEARKPTQRVLKFAGLEELAEESVEALPLAVQHRVALARALVTSPEILIVERVDELLRDAELIAFLELLVKARDQFGVLILFSTETPALAGFADRVLELDSGRIVRDRQPKLFFL